MSSPSPRVPSPDQLEAIRNRAIRYRDAKRRRRDAPPSDDHAELMREVVYLGSHLRKELEDSEARYPHGWTVPVIAALKALVHDVARELDPGPSAVAGHRPLLRYGPSGLMTSIPARPAPIHPSRRVPQPVEDLTALEAAVEELEKAVSGDPVDSRATVVPSSPEPGPEPSASHQVDSDDDEGVWGSWFLCSISVLGRAMGIPSKSRPELVAERMLTTDEIQMRKAISSATGDREEWEFRIRDPALRRRVLTYIADRAAGEMSEADVVAALRRKRRAVDARFVEFMIGRSDASIDDLALHMYGHDDREEKEDAIKASQVRVHRFMQECQLKLRYRFSVCRIYKEEPSE